MCRATAYAIAVLVLISLVAPVDAGETSAEGTRILNDRFYIGLAVGIADLNTSVAAGRGVGAIIGLEDVLGFDEKISSFGITGFWRFTASGRQSLKFGYANFDRDAETVIEGTVPIFDVEFLGRLESSFVNEVGSLEYQYSLVNNGRTEAGISGGLATYRYELTISGEAIINNNPDQSEFRSENVGVIAPVPAFGFFINHALRKNIILQISTSFINLEIGRHDGRIFNTSGTLSWFFSRHVGLGLGLSSSDIYYQNNGDPKFRAEIRQNAVNLKLAVVF